LREEELRFLLSPLTPSSIPPARVSAYAVRAASLSYDVETGLYTFRDLCCQHTPSSAAHQSSSKANCAALEAFHLYWCPELQSIVDKTNKSIVLGRDIQKTLVKVTCATPIHSDFLMRHLRSAYPSLISETDLELDKRFGKIVLKESIPVLRQPVLRYQCNLCQGWFPNIARHRHNVKEAHHNQHPHGQISDTSPTRYFVLPLKAGGTSASKCFQASLKVILDPDFVPHTEENYSDLCQTIPTASSSSEPSPSISNLIIPVYVHQLGWIKYLHLVKGSPKTFLEVKNLAVRSSKHRRGLFKDGTPGFLIEDFLLVLPGLIKQYFAQAELRISTAHGSVREFVTDGAKGSFRSLSNRTLEEYSAVVTNSIAFALRWVSLQREDSMKVQCFTDIGCEPRWKADQLKLSTSFLDQLLANSHNGQDEQLEYIHRFLVFAFTSAFSDGEPIDSIIEQTVLFASFNPTEGWRDASVVINGPLKALQYASRVVSVHCAFLGGTSSTYAPLIKTKETPPL
ncbi:hypothetical protein EI94DRAFT_643413, partial [Lactarius quietus]